MIYYVFLVLSLPNLIKTFMMDPLSSLQPKDVQLDDQLLKRTFTEHLNYIYYGKHHLMKFLQEVEEIARLQVLKLAIKEAMDDTLDQLTQIDNVFKAIDDTPSKTNTLGIKAITLEAYLSAIKAGKTPLEKDVFILFYLQQIEGIEITYFKVLKNLAKAIGYRDVYLEQTFDTAVENEILFEAIYKEYIS